MRAVLMSFAFLALTNSTAIGATACACFPFFNSSGWKIADAQKARKTARHVVRAEMREVARSGGYSGSCRGTAAVTRVERGRKYALGEVVVIDVPCDPPGVVQPLERPGRPWIAMAAMDRGREARLYLSRGGKVQDFEPLGTATEGEDGGLTGGGTGRAGRARLVGGGGRR
jgi:hypothetical protein